MFDIGIGEIMIIAVIGLLVFGPERLPRAAADAAKWLKQMRVMASSSSPLQDLAELGRRRPDRDRRVGQVPAGVPSAAARQQAC